MNKALVLLAALTLALPTYAAEYLVKYKNNLALQNFSATRGMQLMDVHDAGQLMKVNIAENSKVASMVQLLTNPNIEYVVPNGTLYAFTAPVDTAALKDQWAIAKVQAEKAWQRAGNRGSKNILVAVIDTGADYKHQSLSKNMVAGYDFAQNDADPMDTTGAQNPGHGTHCAGIIGATGLVDGGIIGLSPEVSIMPIRFLTENGQGTFENAVKSIDYAIEKGAKVISASWGGAISAAQAKPLTEAIQRAEKAGIVFVAAASNDGKNNDTYEVYPANSGVNNMIVVAASDSNDGKPTWSNYGSKVSLAAPGNAIMSTLPKDTYGNLSGTSMATPLVAGLVALIKAQDPNLTPVQIRSLLQATGAQVAISTACNCRVDAFNAVDTVKSQKMFVSPFAGTFAIGTTTQFEGVYGKAPFEFASSNPAAGTIDANGLFTAVAQGETTVTVKDSTGATSTSTKLSIGKATPPDDGGDPGDGECPLGDPQLCEILCGIIPDAPWCK